MRGPSGLSAGPGYDAVFSETGIPTGDFWSVDVVCNSSFTFSDTTGADAPGTASMSLPNETCVAVGNSWGHGTPTPLATTFTVDGGPVAVPIAFTSASATEDAILFTESGVGNGTSWGVNLSASGPVRNATVHGPYGQVVMFLAPAGSYHATIFVGPGSEPLGGSAYNFSCPGPGDFCVDSLRFVTVAEVTFHAVGLPVGTHWSVRIGSALVNTSTTGTIGFRLTAGMGYTFNVTAPSPYRPFPPGGTFNVTGPPISFSITMAPVYPVTFEEVGLPYGTPWAVTLGGTTNSSTRPTIGFLEPNRTGYPFQVDLVPPGMTASPASGSVPVAGAPVTESVAFTANGGPFGARAWGNETAQGGTRTGCEETNGTVHMSGTSWTVWTYTVRASNGTPPYSIAWTFSDGSGYSGATFVRTYTWPSVAPSTVTVVVQDSAGATNTTVLFFPSAVIPVLQYPPCRAGPMPNILGLSPVDGEVLITGLAAAVVVVVVVVIARKRK